MTTAQIIVCPSCGAKNRVDPQRIQRGEAPVCGRCKRLLLGEAGPVEVTDATFATEVERSPVPVLVDMWAPWCGPCRMLAPTIDQVAAEMAGRIKVAKLNVDENPQTAGRFNISGIPAMLIFKDGREVDRIVGLAPKPQIAQRLQRFL
ncbi:MAG TPA: thioredoxin [Tepidisphaeraceae bacterium]|jgi:thioredoxin 2|nr:thioredoxin [Tepidisphaeraceae bacterium]